MIENVRKSIPINEEIKIEVPQIVEIRKNQKKVEVHQSVDLPS